MLCLTVAFTIPLMLSGASNSAPAGELSDELNFTDPADPAYAAYECVTGGEEEEEEEEPLPDAFCLARCQGFDADEYRATHKKPVSPIEEGNDWCKERARTYCHRFDLDFEAWCWGERA